MACKMLNTNDTKMTLFLWHAKRKRFYYAFFFRYLQLFIVHTKYRGKSNSRRIACSETMDKH